MFVPVFSIGSSGYITPVAPPPLCVSLSMTRCCCRSPAGQYTYIDDLLALDACKPTLTTHTLPTTMQVISTPLHWQAWDHKLTRHPDQRFRDYITSGLRYGFRLGFDVSQPCHRASRNMRSTSEHPQVVRDYLALECAAGRVLGPLPVEEFPQVQLSPLGVIPKKSPGKWRLIMDLSSPEGHSVNDGIPSAVCSLNYVTIDDAAKAIIVKGAGALLAKVDIQSAYRMVPVHPDDRWLLGTIWENALYIDTALPFGLRSAPQIF